MNVGGEPVVNKLTCDQAFFFRRSAKEKQRETVSWRSVGGILSSSSEKITPDRRL